MILLPTPPDAAIARSFSRRLALFYGAVFACFGAHLPFFPLWLSASGLDAQGIGLALALPVAARLAAVPLVTRLADRRHALRGFIRALVVLTLVGMVLTGLAPGPVAIVAVFTVTAAAWGPVLPLTDAYALRGVRRHRIDYGPIRLWGSAAFVAGAVGAGFLSDAIAGRHLIWVIVAAALVGAGTSFLLEPVDDGSLATVPAPPAKLLWRLPALWLVAAAAALVQGSHAGYYSFSAVMWRAEGWSGTTISALWSAGVLAEIVLFALSPRLDLTPRVWLALGAAGALARWLVMTTQPPLSVIGVAQLLHALSFGATHLGTMGLMARLVPSGLTATAQGFLALLSGSAMALASVFAGLLYAPDGRWVYALMLAMAAAALTVLALGWRRLALAPD
ncbi:MAG: MFS transporter [Xanthobacteraceae bacterium]|nr:MAG: MFS transporter [Xanthobacteraceae bacterium]